MDGLRLRSVACSHVGLVRRTNEDSFLDRPDLGLWAVADGMGGMTAGDVASRAIVSALDDIGGDLDAPSILREVRSRITEVNGHLLALAARRGPAAVIGSTVAGLIVRGRHFACFWAGDSRVYRQRNGTLERLTRDHSLVQEMVDAGLLQPDQAESHPRANVIQRAVGAAPEIDLDCVTDALEPGDVFLVCSDGLTRMVGDDELARQIGGTPLEQTSEALLALVLRLGAKDNVTFILVECLP